MTTPFSLLGVRALRRLLKTTTGSKRRQRLHNRIYRLAHRQQLLAYDKARFNKHRIALYEYIRAWRSKNADKMRRYYRRYYHDKRRSKQSKYARSLDGLLVECAKGCRVRCPGLRIYKRTLLAVWLACGGRCSYCGDRLKRPSFDHIRPITRGGTNAKRNLTVCCKSCNSSKGNRLFSEGFGFVNKHGAVVEGPNRFASGRLSKAA